MEDGLELRGLHVLLAEDNEVNRLVMQKMLKRLGCLVDAAANGLDYDLVENLRGYVVQLPKSAK